MDLKKYRSIAPGLNKEVADVLAKYGFKVGKVGATINEAEGTVSLRMTLVDQNLKDETGNATTPEALRYKQNAAYLGMKPDWLNQPVKVGTKTCSIVGLRGGRSEKSILYKVAGRDGTFVIEPGAARVWFGLPRERSLDELRAAAVASAL